MSQIQSKINKLKPYIIGIRFIEESTIIDVVFKEGWVALGNKNIIAKKSGDLALNYHMVYSEAETVTIDDLLDFVEHSINANIEREKKMELFKQKVKDMEELFKKTSLNELEQMKFNLEADVFMPDLFNPTIEKTTIIEELPAEEINLTEEEGEFKEKEIPYNNPKEISNLVNDKNKKIELKSKIIDFDLPPKPNEKIVVEEYEKVASTCKCKPNESCEVCLDLDY